MRWFALLIAPAVCAQTYNVTPQVAKQGDTIRVYSSLEADSARMNGRTIRLFVQKDGGWLGLMPTPVAEKPGAYKLDFLDKTGAILHTSPIMVRDAHFPSQNIVIGKAIAELKASPGETEAATAFRNTVSDIRYWTEPFVAPVNGCLTSPFGVQRLQNGKPTGDFHAGFDQRSAAGSPIRAVSGGVVRILRQFNLRGGTVAIDHGQGLGSMYLHMSKFAATEGAIVKTGDVIGYIGSTGRSTGPHLHWTMYVNSVPVNPGQWVPLHPCADRPKPARKKQPPLPEQ